MSFIKTDIAVSFSDVVAEQNDFAEVEKFYQVNVLDKILTTVVDFLLQNNYQFNHIDTALFCQKVKTNPIELDIYITDSVEGQAINLDARGKDYATNILSYPSDLPTEVLELLPSLPLGELVICHEVVAKQADEQGKQMQNHLTHLIVHGILHLFGFDHELGQAEQDEMESIEIAVLATLGVANPYE